MPAPVPALFCRNALIARGVLWWLASPLTACLAGSFSPALAGACTQCPSNSISAANASTCACNPGYFGTGSGTTLACSGTQRPEQGGGLKSRAWGSWRLLVRCVRRDTVCPANTYNLANGATVCTPCPSGGTSPTGSTACACRAGFSTSGSGASLVCTGARAESMRLGSEARALTGRASMRGGSVHMASLCGRRLHSVRCWYRECVGQHVHWCVPGHCGSESRHQSCCVGSSQTTVVGMVGMCAGCGAGTFSPAQASACTACPTNSVSSANSSTCTCNIGYAQSGTGVSLSCSGI